MKVKCIDEKLLFNVDHIRVLELIEFFSKDIFIHYLATSEIEKRQMIVSVTYAKLGSTDSKLKEKCGIRIHPIESFYENLQLPLPRKFRILDKKQIPLVIMEMSHR